MSRFTDSFIRGLRAKAKTYEVREGSGEGFTVRIHPTGRIVFCTWYVWDGKKRRITHGTYPALTLKAARQKHGQAIQMLANGIDPMAERKPAAPKPDNMLAADFVDEYIEVYAKIKKKSWTTDYRILHKDFIPALGKRPLADIQPRDIVLLLDRIRARQAPYAAEQLLQILKRMFGVAVERGALRPEQNPAQYVKPQVRIREVERVLSDAEIVIAWRLLERQHISIRNALRFIMLTAARVSEASQLPWAEIDGDTWTLAAHRAKQGHEHIRPLVPQTLALLDQQRAISSDYVFSASVNAPLSRGTVNCAVKRELKKQHPGMPAFTPHDLRRTFRTWAEREGVNPIVSERVLGHSLGKLTRVYNRHSYLDEMRSALEAWARHIEQLTRID